MKKKYIALILACLLGTGVFLSGCASSSDSEIEKDDEDDDNDDEDDEDDEDDDDDHQTGDEESEKPSEKPIVELIDGDDLLDQLKIFIDDRDYWTMAADGDEAVYRIGYGVTDLDLDGRIELIISRQYDYSDVSDSYVLEINEAGDDYDFVCQNLFPSMITDDVQPDYLTCNSTDCYYDKENRELHYLITDNFDNGNGNYGALLLDMKKNGENLYFDCYLTISVQQTVDQESYDVTSEYKYYEGNAEISESEYYSIIDSYPDGAVTKPVYFGYLSRNYYQDMYLSDLDDVELKDALYDSYCVFAGTMDQIDFDGTYNSSTGSIANSEVYADVVGDWELYSSEVEGSETYYDFDSPTYMLLYIYDDYSIYFINYEDGEISNTFSSSLDFSGDDPVFEHDIREENGGPDEFGVVRENYMILNHYYEDGAEYLEISADYYGEGEWLGYSILTFRRS